MIHWRVGGWQGFKERRDADGRTAPAARGGGGGGSTPATSLSLWGRPVQHDTPAAAVGDGGYPATGVTPRTTSRAPRRHGNRAPRRLLLQVAGPNSLPPSNPTVCRGGGEAGTLRAMCHNALEARPSTEYEMLVVLA